MITQDILLKECHVPGIKGDGVLAGDGEGGLADIHANDCGIGEGEGEADGDAAAAGA